MMSFFHNFIDSSSLFLDTLGHTHLLDKICLFTLHNMSCIVIYILLKRVGQKRIKSLVIKAFDGWEKGFSLTYCINKYFKNL